ncbi:MAG TPA: alpha-amylase family glycosyl hydrolase [Chitinophagaceae bacterium]|nr:alpha-amylase family glycosyl hydrolase [Chitinophagaceae bacterium]
MKKISLTVFAWLLIIQIAFSQKVYPTHWWVGMKNTKLQLMLRGEAIGNVAAVTASYPGVLVKKFSSPENKNYLFVDLEILASAKPGKLRLSLRSKDRAVRTINYELKSRSKENGKTRAMGVTAKDLIYLMIPDRFANGDPSNDLIPGYREQANDRKNMFTRHGGDFKGITDHLDYFNELGVTTIWMTPVIENNTSLMHEWGNTIAGYHGYWFTDHYEIDKRLGGNDGYKTFCNTLHVNGMKVIQDAVYNHVSKENWFVLDPPMKDWINNWPNLTTPNHREEVMFDPYASAHDKKIMLDGWFTDHLPDLNQRNPYVARFLIQHAIWTTEEYGIDGWRVDTYKYCDEQFMNDVNAALEKEFPKVTVFGESWVNTPTANAYFTRNNIAAPFKHNARGMLDFQVCFAILAGMNDKLDWNSGVNKIYMTLAQDLLYKDPMNNCIFMDNHDMDRVFSVVGEDWNKLKMGFTWLLTLRGIPQIYYGTEVLMKNKKTNTDATVREDFPGGWKEDPASRFTAAGRNDRENEAFNFVSRLANFRKNSSAITNGKTMQFIPRDGLYIYFRYDTKQTVMVVTHGGDKPAKPDWNIFAERIKDFTRVKDVISGSIRNLEGLEFQPKESFVFELVK